MIKLIRSQLYIMAHSRFCLVLFFIVMVFSIALFFDDGDAVKSIKELEQMIDIRGFDGMRNAMCVEEAQNVEEAFAILQKRQVLAAPMQAAGGTMLLIFLLPGILLSPALTKTQGIRDELRWCGRIKPFLSRMLLGWLFAVLISTMMYLGYLKNYTEWKSFSFMLLGRNYIIVQLYVLSGICYSYFMYVLLRKTWIAAPAMLLSEALLHRIIPGLYLFYPFVMIPYYNSHAYQNTTSLVAEGCTIENFIGYCAVCLGYVLICPLLSIIIFKRRDMR